MGDSRSQSLSESEIQELLCWLGCAIDEQLTALLLSNVFALPDGRIILPDGDGGVVWETKDALLSVYHELAGSRPQHLLKGRFPEGNTFIHRIPELLNRLAEKLGLRAEDLDRSWQSLDLIDRIVRDRFSPAERVEAELFVPLFAYLGEVIRKTDGGEWEMRLVDDQGIWEPWVITTAGEGYMPFRDVYKQMYDHSDEVGSLRAVVAVPLFPSIAASDEGNGESKP